MVSQAILNCFNEDATWVSRSKGTSSLMPEKQTTYALSSIRITSPKDGKGRSTRGAENTSSAVLFFLAGHSCVDGQVSADFPQIDNGDTITDSKGKAWTVMSTTSLEGLRGEYRHIEVELR